MPIFGQICMKTANFTPDLGPTAAPVTAPSDHARLGGRKEYRLTNPLREICTAGSVRGEIPSEPWWPYSGTKLETADTAKESLQLLGLLYSEALLWSCATSLISGGFFLWLW
jgi:hypothetical protein